MLASRSEKVRAGWDGLERTAHPQGEVARGTAGVAGETGEVPGRRGNGPATWGVGTMLSWTTEKDPPTYIGEPRAASPQAGERMLDAFADQALERFEAGLEGAPPPAHPLGLEPSLSWNPAAGSDLIAN